MSDFSPSASSARDAGISVTVGAYADGAAGVRQSIEAMALAMRKGADDPRIYSWGRQKLADAGIDGRDGFPIRRVGGVILDAVRAQTIYWPDAYNAEVVPSAAATLCVHPTLCVRGDDCDGLAVALGSVLLALGIPTQIVKQNYGGENQEHVFIVFQDERGNWVYADPSTRAPLGQSPRGAVSEIWVDPMKPIGNIAAAEPKIVTFGQPPPPTSDWQLVTDATMLDGSRYRLGVLIDVAAFYGVAGAIASPSPTLVSNFFRANYNLNVESAAATGEVTGAQESWIIQGVSTKNTMYADTSVVKFVAAAVEISPTTSPSSSITITSTSPVSSSGVSVGTIAVGAASIAVVGGIAWYLIRKPTRRRR